MSFDTLLQEAHDAEARRYGNSAVQQADDLLEGMEDLFDGEQYGDFKPRFDPAIDQYQFFNQTYVAMDDDELEGMYNPERSTELNNYGNHVAESFGYGHQDGSDEFKADYMSGIIPTEEVIFESDDDEALEDEILGLMNSRDDEDLEENLKTR